MGRGPGTYRGALFLDRKISITRTTAAKIPATTRMRVTLSIVAPAFPFVSFHLRGKKHGRAITLASAADDFWECNPPKISRPRVLFDELNAVRVTTLTGAYLCHDSC